MRRGRQRKIIEREAKNQMLLQTIRSAALLVAASLLCSAQRPGDFRVLGPGGGGAMFNPTISPVDPNTVLVSCDMTGSYITHNGGQSWRMFNLRGTVKFFAFDPKDPKILYAEATGLWRSQDTGQTWKLVHPKPSCVKGIQMSSDHADETILADPDPLGSITALAIDPDATSTLYAAASNESVNALFVSRDAGETWSREAILPEPALSLWLSGKAFILGCAHSIYVKTPNWHEIISGAHTGRISLFVSWLPRRNGNNLRCQQRPFFRVEQRRRELA